MYRIERTVEFENWLDELRDRTAQKRIVMRIRRAQTGLLGEWKTHGDGVSEMKVDHGPGYRLYFTIRNQVIVILLCGSDKQGQDRAIKLAKERAKLVLNSCGQWSSPGQTFDPLEK